jgi:hypothetical protein
MLAESCAPWPTPMRYQDLETRRDSCPVTPTRPSRRSPTRGRCRAATCGSGTKSPTMKSGSLASRDSSPIRDDPQRVSAFRRRPTRGVANFPWYGVEQRGIEPRPPYAPSVANGRVNDEDQATRDDQRRREVSASPLPETDVVVAALAEAVKGAASAERWDVVAQLARELEARRIARAGNVVPLGSKRAKRSP